MKLLELPNDILEKIFDELYAPSDLKEIIPKRWSDGHLAKYTLVCQTFANYIHPRLVQYCVFDTAAQFVSFSRLLERKPLLCLKVERLSVDFSTRGTKYMPHVTSGAGAQAFARLLKVLPFMVQLLELTLKEDKGWNPGRMALDLAEILPTLRWLHNFDWGFVKGGNTKSPFIVDMLNGLNVQSEVKMTCAIAAKWERAAMMSQVKTLPFVFQLYIDIQGASVDTLRLLVQACSNLRWLTLCNNLVCTDAGELASSIAGIIAPAAPQLTDLTLGGRFKVNDEEIDILPIIRSCKRLEKLALMSFDKPVTPCVLTPRGVEALPSTLRRLCGFNLNVWLASLASRISAGHLPNLEEVLLMDKVPFNQRFDEASLQAVCEEKNIELKMGEPGLD